MTNTREQNIGAIIAAAVGIIIMSLYVFTGSTTSTTPSAQPAYVRLSTVAPVNGDDAPLHDTIPACEYEDASGPKDAPVCRWDAATAGLANGGQSFTAYAMTDGTLFVYDNGERTY